MQTPVFDPKFFRSLHNEYRVTGEALYKDRKKDFTLSIADEHSVIIKMPLSKNSRTTVEVLLQENGKRTFGVCRCNEYLRFKNCRHVAAAALFAARDGAGKPAVPTTEKHGISSHSNIGYELAALFHIGAGDIGFALKPVLLLTRDSGQRIERFSKLPNVRDSLMAQLPNDVQNLLRSAENGKKSYIAEFFAPWKLVPDENDPRFCEAASRFYWNILMRLWPTLCGWRNLFSLDASSVFKIENMASVVARASAPTPEFYVYKEGKNIIVQLKFLIDGVLHDARPASTKNCFFTMVGNEYYLLQKFEYVELLKKYRNGYEKLPFQSKIGTYNEVIVPLRLKYKVTWSAELDLVIKEVEPQPFVVVAEYVNAYLMMEPHFMYDEHEVAYDDKKDIVGLEEGEEYLIRRDFDFERAFYERLRPLHKSFERQLRQAFYYVPFQDLMKSGWLLKTIRKLQDENIPVRGLENLKRFKHSTVAPKFQMSISSGIDWFDMTMQFSYAKTTVPLKDIQTAVLSGQNMVVLEDGSFGVLPEDWLQQFAGVLKMGTVKGNHLRLNNKLFSLLQDVELNIKEERVLKELEEKKKSLLDLNEANAEPLSEKIKASLRPYQLDGFHWMQSLDHLGWGGCLADDMGLGKTVQTISFLQFLKEKYRGCCNLVVCPTSLIYNWEDELKKFAPSLNYFIYYGPGREFGSDYLEKYDVIITSYSTVRNDIDILKKYVFQYIVLDESQTIKNPEARTTKACCLLEARNRLLLSGTPVQNNTFDLFAQMNFLNPGLLGNKHFFKNHFAIPIDRDRDPATIQRLKKMITPFILRRTKEKVATDLPDKSETILWCQMREQQRTVYEYYKNEYRKRLMQKINLDGIKKSSFEILEGMTRLRQICDSPQLIKDTSFGTTESTKIRELLRELNENVAEHKVLVFSQFTQMLALIRQQLEQAKLKFAYLDGQTPGKVRMELVKDFQQDDSVKVFLISLKAGGVGLNLTAADYVYLVDPWWNPAAEAQAIDRTHRIGQKQKIFAYKMICKDSIEEKIIQLQQRKKSLSEDLISEETSFVSKLTKEDIAFLFA